MGKMSYLSKEVWDFDGIYLLASNASLLSPSITKKSGLLVTAFVTHVYLTIDAPKNKQIINKKKTK